MPNAEKISGDLQRWIAPSLQYSQYLYEDSMRETVSRGDHWLDLGCGHQLLPPWRREEEKQLFAVAGRTVGLDFDLPSLRHHKTLSHRVQGTASALPFADESFHMITANMVAEHLEDPETQFREINRVLKPGGFFVFHTPNILGYYVLSSWFMPQGLKNWIVQKLQNRQADDVFPTFYRANLPGKIKTLARASGFKVSRLRLVASSPQFRSLPPAVFFELLWIRLLLTRPFRRLRTNIIAVLEKLPPD